MSYRVVYGETLPAWEKGGRKMIIDQIKWALDNFGAITDQRGREVPWRKPPICIGCGKNRSDPPSPLCPGCQAYQEHQR